MDTINQQTLSPSNSGRRTTTDSNSSPEFEFCPSFPQPNLLFADQLFVHGVLLPSTNLPDPPPDPSQPDPSEAVFHDPEPDSSPSITESTSNSSPSKRWKDIFKKKTAEKEKEKLGKKKERKTANGAGSAAELNINIWPFSRSRSAGNAGTRPALFPGSTRKVNSAPCSRSNSAGESKSRKWPSSPGRPGVHVGRSSPVWQVRRAKTSEPPQEGSKKKETAAACRRSKAGSGGGGKARVLNLNVPMCIRPQLSCRSDENGALGGAASIRGGGNNCNNGGGSDGGSGGNIFNLRNLFTKKSTVTSH